LIFSRVWTSPTGHTYTVPPATYPLDNTTKIKKDDEATGEMDGPTDTGAQ
jgi:hypothetical protein